MEEKETVCYKLPLQPEEITNIFLRSDEVNFQISIDGVKPNQVLMFLKNIKKSVEVVGLNKEFIKVYMTSDQFIYSKNLPKVHANIMYYDKYGHTLHDDALDDFSLGEIQDFVATEEEIVEAHRDFLEAIPMFLTVSTMITSKEEKDKNGNPSTVRDDSKAMEFVSSIVEEDLIIEEKTPLLGFNLVQCCNLEDFLFSYLDESDIFYMFRAKWFARMFEEYKFDKKYLIFWLEKTSFAQHLLGVYRYLSEGNYSVDKGFAVPSLGDRLKVNIHEGKKKVKQIFTEGSPNA